MRPFPHLPPWRLALLGVALSLSVLTGCREHPSARPAVGSTAPLRTFHVRGKVVSTDATHVTLDHEAIQGFMGAMTMAYELRDPSVASELHPGDRITANVLVHQEPDGTFSGALLDQIVVVAQARPDYKPAVEYHVPTPGEPIPDFALLNQDGRTIHLRQFRGKTLLITFIYTRCPLADFCPRMSRNFAEIDRALARDAKLYGETHLLSISFDPAFDTPRVLHAYAEAYTGRPGRGTSSHWDFAAPSQAELPQVTHFFNVGITGADNPATLAHSLSTLLVGKDGAIAGWYPSNDWQPSEVLKALERAAGA